MDIRQLVDVVIDEDPRAPCLWAPAEHFGTLCEALGRKLAAMYSSTLRRVERRSPDRALAATPR